MEELMAVPKATVPGVGESHHRPATPIPYPLPMPAYGGYFAPIYELLPAGELPNPPYQRWELTNPLHQRSDYGGQSGLHNRICYLAAIAGYPVM